MATSKQTKTTSTTTRTKKVVSPKSATTTVPQSSTSSAEVREMKVSRKMIIIGLIVIVVLFVLYSARSLFIAELVNGQPVSRLAIIQQLEQQGGKQALDRQTVQVLVLQEAQRRGITVSDAEINAQLKTISDGLAKQGQTLDQALAAQGMTKGELIDQMRIQKLAEKMVGPITVTNKQINDYIEQNKASIPENSNMDQIKQTVKQQLEQQALQTKFTELVTNLRKKATIVPLVNY